MKRPTPMRQLHEETVAMSQFLEAMFRVPEQHDSVVTSLPVVPRPIADVEQDTAQTEVEEDSPVTSAVVEQEDAVKTYMDEQVDEQQETLKIWRSEPFEAMLINVGVLKLTLPLIELGSVVPIPGKMTDLPGQPQWVIGVFKHQDKNVKVVDTASLVMPDNASVSEIDYQRVVLIGNGEWGLACCAVSDVFKLEQDHIRWRGEVSKRKWLAGTVIDKMSGLLDIDEFLSYLENKLH